MDDEVGTREAAERLGVTRMAILQRLASGRLRGRRTATGTWRIPRTEVDRLAHAEPPLAGYLTVQEAADALGVATGTIRRWLLRGQLTEYEPRRRVVLIPVADVERMTTMAQPKRGPKPRRAEVPQHRPRP